MKGRVPAKLAQKRAAELEELQANITAQKLEDYVGKEFSVLIEEVLAQTDDSEGLAIGRAWFQAPDVDGSVVIRFDSDDEKQLLAVQSGNLVKVKILASTSVDLDARFISLIHKNEKKGEHNFIF